MTQHISDAVLDRFVAGDLDEAEAVSVARHLDECVSCTNRSVAREPLSAAFAAVEDPEVPEDFAASVLAELDRPQLPLMELGVGLGLLLSAAGLIFLVDGPVRPVIDSFTFSRAATAVLDGFLSSLSLGEQAAVLLLALLGVIGTIRFATGRASGWFGSSRRTA
ncbi:MAG: zf-HC2 domain-containing protein [Myxococcota bacterium]